ncbi:ABC transporter permease [Anaerobacillus sp. MEB173]|uniref:ABC transporter permease n=1 Tax=Anaerobacillus sp. MEB173 TaxID=3383345 RepID=UPI003F901D87
MNSTGKVAWSSIKRKRSRALILVASTAITAFIIFSSYFFLHSLHNSVAATEGRLGADLIIVPEGMAKYAGENALSGVVMKQYLDEKKVSSTLAAIPEVQEYAPQLYLETVSTVCCGTEGDFPIVAFEPKDDFTLSSYMVTITDFEKDDVVIGANAGGDRFIYHYDDQYITESVQIFNERFRIKNVLFPTGAATDETIFMRLDRARELIQHNELLTIPEQAVSVIFVNTKKGMEEFVMYQIKQAVDGIDIVLGNQLKAEIKQQLLPVKLLSYFIIALVLVMSLMQIMTLFSAMMMERQKEIGMLRAMGVSKKNTYHLLIMEAAIISVIGAVVGIVASLGLIYDHKTMILMLVQLPLVFPDVLTTLYIGFVTLLITVGMTMIGSLFPIRTVLKVEPYEAIREGEV